MFDDLMNLINTIVGIAALLFTIYSTSKDSKIAKSETIIIEPYIRVGILFSPSSRIKHKFKNGSIQLCFIFFYFHLYAPCFSHLKYF